MTEDYDIRPNSAEDRLIAHLELVKFAEDVTNHNATSGQFLYTLVGESYRLVIVPADRKNLGDRLQSPNHIELADIASVYDRVDSEKNRHYRFVEKAVGV